VDFGEANDQKYFILAEVSKGAAEVTWRELENIRPFIDLHVTLESSEGINQTLQTVLPTKEEIEDAVVRLVVEYRREWESLIDEAALRTLAAGAFEFHLVKRPQMQARVRLPEGRTASSMGVIELLDIYWKATNKDMETEKQEALNRLAKSIVEEVNTEE
jgi:exonuclease SbcD